MLQIIPLLLTALLLWTAPAWAAITVGSAVTAKVDGSGTTIAAPAIVLTAGQGAEVCVKWEGNVTLTSVTSDQGDTIVLQTAQQHSALEPSARCAHVLSAVGGSTVFTGTTSGASTYRRIHVYPITYAPNTLALDVQSVASTEDNADITPSSASVTTTGTDEVCFGFHADYTTQTFSSETINGVAADGHSSQSDTDLFYKIFTGTFTGAASLTRSNTERWIQRLACLKATGGAPPPPPTVPRYWLDGTNGSDSNSCSAINSQTLPGNLATGAKRTFLSLWNNCLTNGAEQRVTVMPGTYTATWHNLAHKDGLSTVQRTIIEGYNVNNGAGCAIALTCNTVILSPPDGQSIDSPSHMEFRYLKFRDPRGAIACNGCMTVRFGGTGSDIVVHDVEITNGPGQGVFTTTGITAFQGYNNYIHDHALDPTGGHAGGSAAAHAYYIGGNNHIVERNLIVNIGNNTSNSNSYGVQCYAAGTRANNCLIRSNKIHSTILGMSGIVVNGSGDVISHNEIDGCLRGVDTGYSGTPSSPTGIVIANNVIYGCSSVAIRSGNSGTSETVLSTNNIILNNGGFSDTAQYNAQGSSVITKTTEKKTGTITDCTVSTTDFSQKAGSSCINQGTAVTGLPFNTYTAKTKPDQGAHETASYSTATVTGNTLSVTVGMNLNTPVQAGGTGEWVALVGGVARTTTAVQRKSGSDSTVDITFNGAACANGETWTVTHTAGSASDSALIGTTLNQLIPAFTAQPTINLCAGSTPPASVLSQVAHQFYNILTSSGVLSALNASNTNVHGDTPFELVLQTDCTIANCAPFAQALYYSITPLATGIPSAFAPIPDTMGTDQIAFYGVTADPLILQGPVTCCLSGALTPLNGTTNFTSAQVPNIDLPQDGSVVQRYALRLGPSAILGDIYTFKVYQSTGTALDSYTPSGGAKITVSPTAVISAPSNLHRVGPASNNIVELVWMPNTDVALAGYRVYQSSISGETGTLIGTITAGTAAATHSSMTQFRTVINTAGTYYFTVTAFDTGDTESGHSAEVAVTLTGFIPRTLRTP